MENMYNKKLCKSNKIVPPKTTEELIKYEHVNYIEKQHMQRSSAVKVPRRLVLLSLITPLSQNLPHEQLVNKIIIIERSSRCFCIILSSEGSARITTAFSHNTYRMNIV